LDSSLITSYYGNEILLILLGISNVKDIADTNYLKSTLKDLQSDVKDFQNSFNHMVHSKYLLPENAENLLKISLPINTFLFFAHVHNINRHLILRKKIERKAGKRLTFKEFMTAKDKFNFP